LKCLILAAGKGTRISRRGDSKPLLPLMGLSIIERVILTAKNSGIEEFYIVTGYNGERVRPFLDKVAKLRNVKITHLINEEWEEGNGLSVLKAKEVLKENFILLMGDHLFDEDILMRLKNMHIDSGEIILAVDSNTGSNNLVDLDDVTKVSVNNHGQVVDIGKDLTHYTAYDTGIFLCSPAIFTAIEKSIMYYNDSSLSGGVRILSREGKAKVFDIDKDNFWIDIDDERSFKKAEKCLMDRLKKSADGPVSRYLNRPLSRIITKYLVRTDITPNQISVFSFILSMIATTFFFLSGYIPLLIGAILAQISSIIDGCDGEIARLKYRESDFGSWFDAVLDRYADAFMLFGLTYHVFVPQGDIFYLIIGFLAIIGSFMNSYTADKYDGLMRERFEKKSYFRIGRDVRVFIIFICVLLNQPFFALLILALLMNIETIRRIRICYSSLP